MKMIKAESLGNFFTVVVFTIVPIILFSILGLAQLMLASTFLYIVLRIRLESADLCVILIYELFVIVGNIRIQL